MINGDVAVIVGIAAAVFTVIGVLKQVSRRWSAIGTIVTVICILVYFGVPFIHTISFIFLLVLGLLYKHIKSSEYGFQILFVTVLFIVFIINAVVLFAHEVDSSVYTSPSDYTQKAPEPEININYNSDTAQMQEIISGTAKNIPDEYKLCILVYSKDAYKYYPQNKPLEVVNGEWSVPVTIGTKDNVGTQSEIIAVLANKDARAAFTSYMVNCNKTGNWPGMLSIPYGATEYARITVTRV